MLKNYYKILGVDILANDENIKKAYRSKARQYHPDLNRDNPECEEILKELNEAYEILGNKEKRASYDIQLKYCIAEPIKHVEPNSKQYATPAQTMYKTKLLQMILVFCCIILVAGIVLFFEYNYLTNVKKNSIEPGMNIEQVIKIYGDPDEISKEQIKYGTSIILISNDTVDYWYNADDVLTIKNYKIEKISDIKIGENVEDIFLDYGYPDTYAKTFFTYYDVVIMYKNGKVTDVMRIE